jgi:hypothetical protein
MPNCLTVEDDSIATFRGGIQEVRSMMEPTGCGSQSFIVKIWIEETLQEAGKTRWRGHVTHVPSGKRRYFEDLREISTIIRPYLAAMGVRQDWRHDLARWWRKLVR